jgi:CheY-like chemotaxis protein
MISMPLFYYPTQIVWVDDDEIFLQSVCGRFENTFNIKTYSSPDECLSELQNKSVISAELPLLKGSKDHEEYDLIDHMPVDINLNSMHALRNNDKRYDETSVIIVDYNMPGKTGIDLCYELRSSPVKKILLTGEASNQLAVDAFNKGIIDCFIRKDEPTLSADLISHVKRLQLQYFIETSNPLLSHLEADYKLPQSDPQFSDFFEQWSKENNIHEYYLIDKNGILLTQNKSGEVKYFITHTDRSLDTFTKLYAEDLEVASFIEDINQRAKIPFFGLKKESWDYEFTQWTDHFYSPSLLHGRERYYWAVVPE